MNDLIGRVFSFEKTTFPQSGELFAKLTSEGQEPKALMISCADSRIVPEQILQAQPGDLFVCRNAGNMVPPFATMNGGVSSTVEYAVVALGVRDIIVCGHSDCGAMKAFLKPEALSAVPNVAAWLRHSHAAECAVNAAYPHLEDKDKAHALAMENVIVQIQHLRTHPSVAAAMARGELTLHGWFFEIESGAIYALDGERGTFSVVDGESPLPVAVAPREATPQLRWAAAR
jgi:carbonic anhydrase